MGVVVDVEFVEIGLMLEVVGVEIAAVQRKVGLHIVGVLDDVKGIPLGLKVGAGGFEDFRVGHDGGADLDGHGGDGLAVSFAFAVGGGIVFGAGGEGDGRHQEQGEQKRQFLFHG